MNFTGSFIHNQIVNAGRYDEIPLGLDKGFSPRRQKRQTDAFPGFNRSSGCQSAHYSSSGKVSATEAPRHRKNMISDFLSAQLFHQLCVSASLRLGGLFYIRLDCQRET